MYKVAIPITNRNTNEKNRDIYAELFKKAKTNRIFLGGHINEGVDAFKENLRYFKDQGFEVALWFHDTVGHGGTIVGAKDSGEKPKYTRLVDLDGNHHFGTYCPLDSDHRAYFAQNLAKFASLKPDFIMLDDDFRLSQHGGVPCCCCELQDARDAFQPFSKKRWSQKTSEKGAHNRTIGFFRKRKNALTVVSIVQKC